MNGKKIVGLAVARRNCRGGMFVHGGGQHGRRKLLWQFTVAIKSDPVAPDLETKSGVTIEVKVTTHRQECRGNAAYYRWDARTQSEALKGNRPIADVWVFLIATFPRATSGTSSVARAFDLKNWTCYLVTGEQLRTADCKRYVSEATLQRLGVEAFPLAELKKRLNHEIH